MSTYQLHKALKSKKFAFVFLLFWLSILSQYNSFSQCPSVKTILVNACGTEHLNEFMVIHSGGGFNVNDLFIDFDANNNNNSSNHDININANPCGFATGNPAVYTGCPNLIPIGPGFNVPANSIVILQTSSGANANYNFAPFCGGGQCVYILSNSCTRTVGAFTNQGSGTRTTIIGLLNQNCDTPYTYDLSLIQNSDGAFLTPPSTYGVAGCNMPPIPPATYGPIPTFDPQGPYCQGESFTLPGTSNNGINGTWSPAINNQSTTTYTFTPTAGQCASTATITVEINPGTTPTFDPQGPYCQGESFTLPGTSNNGITGTWSPAINNQSTTTYTFTPTAGQCASTATLTVEINPGTTPTFDPQGPYCQGESFTLPGTSNNGITGTWSPAINNQSTTTYTFTPTAGQCASTASLTVTINPSTTPTFDPQGPYCQGENFTLPETSNNGINGTWSPAINNQSTTTYTFTPTAGQCASTATLTITINPSTTPTFDPQGPYCQGENFTLPGTSNNGISGTWSPAINNQSTTTYTFTPTAGQCASTATLTITINPSTTPTFDPQGPYCQGENFTLPGTSNNGITGTWSPSINNQSTTTYTFTPTAGQCASTATLTVTINPSTTPTFDPQGPYCQGESFTLPGTSNNGITGTWSPAINNQSTTTYTFTPTAGQCASTATLTITINPSTTPTFDPQGPYCQGENFTLPGTSNNGINGTWSPAINNQSTTTYTFTPTAGQCASTATLTVTINPSTTPTFDPQGPYCQGENFTLPGTSNNGINGSWSPAINNQSTTTYTFTPTAGQCASTATLTVTINPSTTPTFDPQGPYCQGENFNLPGTSNNGITGTWSPAINNQSTTTYTFTPTAGQCASTASLTVEINPSTTPTFDPQGPYCQGENFNLPGTSNNGINGTWSPAINNQSTTTYTFTPTAGQCASTTTLTVIIGDLDAICQTLTNESTPGANDGSAQVTISGTYPPFNISLSGPTNQNIPNQSPGIVTFLDLPPGSYQVMVTDNLGCEQTCTFVINPSGCQLTASILNQENVTCFGFQNGSVEVQILGNNGIITYEWDGPVNIGNSPVGVNLSAGTYFLTATDASNCIITLQVVISEPDEILLNCNSLSPESSPGVEDGECQITIFGGEYPGIIVLTGPYSININISSEGSIILDNLPGGSYMVEYIDANGCSKYCSFDIWTCLLEAEITIENPILCFGDNNGSIITNISGNAGTVFYQWDQGLPPQPNHSNLIAGIYNLTLTDTEGCVFSTSILLEEPEILTLSCLGIPEENGNDGSIELTIIGGTSPYSISCSGPITLEFFDVLPGNFSINSLPAGTYIISITDSNGCISTCQTIVSGINCNMIGSLIQTEFIQCFGQFTASLFVEVEFANGIIEYNWDGPVAIPTNENAPQNLPAGIYAVTITDEEGCSVILQIQINEPDPLTLSGTSLPESSPGASDGSCTIQIDGGTLPFNLTYSGPLSGVLSDIQIREITIANLPPGLYNFQLIDDNGCTANLEILVRPALCNGTLTLAIQQNILCHGDSTGVITAQTNNFNGELTFNWSGPIQISSDEDTPNNLPAGNFSVTVTDESGCTATGSIVLNQPNPLTITCGSISVSSPSMSDGAITFQIGGGTGGYTVNYTGPLNGSETYPFAGNYTINNLSTGNYTIIVTDENGCSNSCQTLISSSGCSLFLLGSFTPPTCHGGSNGRIRIIPNGAQGNVTYTWIGPVNPGNVSESNMLVAGTYRIAGVDEAFCTDTFTIVLTEPLPILLNCQVDQLESSPGAGDAQISFNWTNGNPQFKYSVTGPNGTSESFTSNRNATVNQLTPGIYTIIVTDVRGCSASCTLEITGSLPCELTVEIEIINSLKCYGDNNASIKAVTQNAIGSTVYTWSSNLGNTNEIQNLPAGYYEITVTDDKGCVATSGITIISPSELLMNCSPNAATGPSSNDGSIDITLIGGTNPYSLQYNGPVSGNIGLNGTNFTLSNIPPGIYTFTLTDVNGCQTECAAEILSDPCLLDLECQIIQSPSTGQNNGELGFSWNTSEEIQLTITLPSGRDSVFTSISPLSITALPAGVYKIFIESENGCLDSCSIELINLPCNISSTAEVKSPTCNNGDGGMINLSINNSFGNVKVNWSNGAEGIQINNLTAGRYSFTITDEVGCTHTGEIILENPPALQWEALSVINGNCSVIQGKISLQNIQNSSLPGILRIGNKDIEIINFPYLSELLNPGQYALQFIDNNGCSIDTILSISAPERIVFIPKNDLNVEKGTIIPISLEFIGDLSLLLNVDIYFNDSLLCSGCTNFNHTAIQNGTFTARLTDKNGCIDEITWLLRIPTRNPVFIPDIFTPNRDGINDVFRIFDDGSVKEVSEMEIFNRWGDRVFYLAEAASIENATWDGTHKNMLLNADVFVYYIRVLLNDGTVYKYAGEVFLAQ